MTLEKVFKNYSLSIVLFILFFLSWVGQFYFQWEQFTSESESHGQIAMMSEYLPEFLAATFENWQSEFLQLFSMVVLTSFLVHKGSPESKDSQEKTDKKLNKILSKTEG